LEEPKKNGVTIQYRLLAFIGYWSPLISLIAGFVARKKNKFALFHSIQGGLVNVVLIIVSQLVGGSIIATDTPLFLSLLWLVLWLSLWVFLLSLLFLMVSAFWGKRYHFPLMGKFSEQLADRWFVSDQSDQGEEDHAS
jgi:uncharacterized membrane protein